MMSLGGPEGVLIAAAECDTRLDLPSIRRARENPKEYVVFVVEV